MSIWHPLFNVNIVFVQIYCEKIAGLKLFTNHKIGGWTVYSNRFLLYDKTIINLPPFSKDVVCLCDRCLLRVGYKIKINHNFNWKWWIERSTRITKYTHKRSNKVNAILKRSYLAFPYSWRPFVSHSWYSVSYFDNKNDVTCQNNSFISIYFLL